MNVYQYLGLGGKDVTRARNEVDAAYQRFRQHNLTAHWAEFMLDHTRGYEAFCWGIGQVVKIKPRGVDGNRGPGDLTGLDDRLGVTFGYAQTGGRWGVRVRLSDREAIALADRMVEADIPQEVLQLARGEVRNGLRERVHGKVDEAFDGKERE